MQVFQIDGINIYILGVFFKYCNTSNTNKIIENIK